MSETLRESQTLRGRIRLALRAGLVEGDRAVELSDRVREVLASEQWAGHTLSDLLRDWPEEDI